MLFLVVQSQFLLLGIQLYLSNIPNFNRAVVYHAFISISSLVMTKWDDLRTISCNALGKTVCNGILSRFAVYQFSFLPLSARPIVILNISKLSCSTCELWIFIFIDYVYCIRPMFFHFSRWLWVASSL